MRDHGRNLQNRAVQVPAAGAGILYERKPLDRSGLTLRHQSLSVAMLGTVARFNMTKI
jgi:hypothetical protein